MNDDAPHPTPATWDDLERAALNDPYLHWLVTVVRSGKATREQVLIAAVLSLSRAHTALLQQNTERRMREIPERMP